MSLAIKKIFPNFYRITKNITNQIPMKVSLWNKKSYSFNFRIYKMLKLWNQGSLKEESDFAYEHYNGGDFIDVGSFSCFYSFLLSPKAQDNDNFISCEPDPKIRSDALDNLSILKKNFQKINYSLITDPVGNEQNVGIAHDQWGHPCYLDLKKIEIEKRKNIKILKSSSVDKLVDEMSLKPTFIKIDTEGSELDILEGMKKTIKNYKPKILLEKHPTMIPKTISIENIDSYLKDNNYKPKMINKNDLAIREIWE